MVDDLFEYYPFPLPPLCSWHFSAQGARPVCPTSKELPWHPDTVAYSIRLLQEEKRCNCRFDLPVVSPDFVPRSAVGCDGMLFLLFDVMRDGGDRGCYEKVCNEKVD